ncbi:MAG: MFS transporter, partial [Gaiellaceae bacterium]
MVILLGMGSAIYWSNTNALVQEVISSGELVAANSAVLIAVQGGLAISGGLVGFIYDRAGIAGILALDASSYFVSAFCLYRLRRGYFAPHVTHRIDLPEPLETPLAVAEETSMPPLIEPAFEAGFIGEFREGIHYLRNHPNVLALGLTYACMIAGVISANVLVVALTKDILRAGATGYGLMESGWAVGAVAGGFAAGFLVKRIRPARVLMTSLITLAIGNALFPYARWLAMATIMHGIFGACRALGGVLTQSAIMTAVPRKLMGRTQSAFAVLSTLMQIMMRFSLGWLAEYSGLPIAFALLGIIYGGAVAAAFRARSMANSTATVEALPR